MDSENEPAIDAGDLEWLTHWMEGAPGRFETAVETDCPWAKTLQPMLDRADAGEWQPELGATMIDLIEQFAELVLADNPRRATPPTGKGCDNSFDCWDSICDGDWRLEPISSTTPRHDRSSVGNRTKSESHLNLKQLMESLSAGRASPDHTPTP